MIFTVQSKQVRTLVQSAPNVRGVQAGSVVTQWHWTLRDGSEKNPGPDLVVSADRYDSEEACRSAIAAFRKKAGGMKFAKVVTT
jgi:hypothetical protein